MKVDRQFDYGITESAMTDEDMENYSVWIWDAVHFMPGAPPFTVDEFCDHCAHSMQYGAEMLSCPETKGWEWRHLNGHIYLAVIEPKPEEVPEREKLFRERMMPFVDDPVGGWTREREEAVALYKPIKEVDPQKLSNLELRALAYNTYENMHRRAMEIHFKWMYAMFNLDALFSTLCEELTGIMRDDPMHAKLRSGFDNMLFRADEEIWTLGHRAVEMGLGDLFLSTEDNDQLMSDLETSEVGRKWLEEYRKFLSIYGWRCERCWDPSTPSWIEQPSLGLLDVRRAVSQGGEHRLDAERRRLSQQREAARKELLAKVPAEQRRWFEKLLGVAEISGSWSEDHNHYLDYPLNAMLHKVYVEIGRRFAQAGVIDEPYDVFCLLPREIPRNIVPLGRTTFQHVVKERKEQWQKVRFVPPPPFLGNPEKLPVVGMKDAVIGVEAALPVARPELKADLYGAASAPGVAEGTARVIMSEAQLAEVQPGEILVSPFTGPPWVSVFNIVKAVVTDMGGSLSHAVIVGREYGLPVVGGTLEATQKIKTGDIIKVDGDLCAVYIVKS